MSYVIYNKVSTKLVGYARSTWCVDYATEAAAKAGLTRLVKSGQVVREDYAITDRETFHSTIEKTKKVKNLMSGIEVEIPVNTPNCCDVSSETYWSM